MPALDLPAVLKPRDVLFALTSQTRGGGQPTSGPEQVVTSYSSRWRATMTFSLMTDAQILAARALIARLIGRVGTLLVPVFDARRASWPVDAQGRTLHPGFTRDRSLDGTIYEAPAIPTESEIVATVDTSAALRAIQLAVEVTQGEPLIAGQYLGLGNYLHIITHVIGTAGTVQTLGIAPSLRAAVSAGATVKLTRPVCEMRLAADDVGEVLLRNLRFGQLDLDLVEAF